jgi:hypothetical protein
VFQPATHAETTEGAVQQFAAGMRSIAETEENLGDVEKELGRGYW